MKKPRFRLPNIKYVRDTLLNSWQPLLLICGFLVIAGVLMFWRLGSLVPGLSETEALVSHSTNNLSAIGDNMVNAPYKLSVLLSTRLSDSALGLRLPGAALGIVAITLFYLLVKQVLRRYIALATTTMFATSSLLLATSRQATDTVMLLSLLAIIASGFYLRFGKRHDIGWLLIVLVISFSLYVPGMIIFIIPAVIWQFHHARKSFYQLDTKIIIAASIVMGVLCAPLVISLVRNPGLWRGYLGLPEQLAPLTEMVQQAGRAAVSLLAYSPVEPTFWLGRQPVLDVFASVMFVYGLSALVKQYRLDRLWGLAGVFLLAFAWIGVTGNHLGVVLLLPCIYLIIGFGMQQLINLWLQVFPRNPIARWVGSLLFAAAVCLSVNFQAYRYFVAWPNSDETKAVFIQEYPR